MAELLKPARVGVIVWVGDRLLDRAGQTINRTVHGAGEGGEECKVYPPSSMLGELDILSIMSSSVSASPSPCSAPSSPAPLDRLGCSPLAWASSIAPGSSVKLSAIFHASDSACSSECLSSMTWCNCDA